MKRFEVKVRTPKGDATQVRVVEAIAQNSVSAGISVLQLLGINSLNFKLTVRCTGEVSHA